MVYAQIYLTYSKGYIVYIRLACYNYIIMILSISESFTSFFLSHDVVTVTVTVVTIICNITLQLFNQV